VICIPAQLPELFAETPIPRDPISDEAADAIARLLWEAAEGNSEHQGTTLVGTEEHSSSSDTDDQQETDA
jgi:hypothetical protein